MIEKAQFKEFFFHFFQTLSATKSVSLYPHKICWCLQHSYLIKPFESANICCFLYSIVPLYSMYDFRYRCNSWYHCELWFHCEFQHFCVCNFFSKSQHLGQFNEFKIKLTLWTWWKKIFFLRINTSEKFSKLSSSHWIDRFCISPNKPWFIRKNIETSKLCYV